MIYYINVTTTTTTLTVLPSCTSIVLLKTILFTIVVLTLTLTTTTTFIYLFLYTIGMAEQQQQQEQVDTGKVINTVLDIIASTKASTRAIIRLVSIYTEPDYTHVRVSMDVAQGNKLALNKYVKEYKADNKVEYEIRFNGVKIEADQCMYIIADKLYNTIADNKQVQAIFYAYNVLRTLSKADLVEVFTEILV
jgi:hypothetical protein